MTSRSTEDVILQRQADGSTAALNIDDATHALLTVDRLAGCLFLCACLFTFGRQLYESRGYYFVGDDWPLLHMGLSWGGYLQPYNDHLSIASVATYRIFGVLFGINHTLPIQIFAALSYVAISIVLYVIARPRVGSAFALLAACAVLFYPQFNIVLSAFNHYLALVGIVAVAGLLPKPGRRYDWALFAVLCFALASSGVAVAGSAGCLVFLLLIRPNWRRWLAVLVPCAFWLIWFERYSPDAGASKTYIFGDLSRYAWRGTMTSFRGLVFDNYVGGIILAIAFVVLFVWRCRRGLHAVAFSLSWFAAEIGWWIGISQTRTFATHPEDVFRYKLVGSVFLILAMLPTFPRPVEIGTVAHGVARGWRYATSKPALAGIAVVCLLFGFMNPVVGANSSNNFSARLHSWLLVEEAATNMGPKVVPDSATITSPMLNFPVSQYRKVVKAYGFPTGSKPADFDRFVVERQSIALQKRFRSHPITCVYRVGVISVPPPQLLILQAGERAVDVRVRFLGQDWISLGRIKPHQRSSLGFPWMIVDRDWQVDAPGACSLTSKMGS